MIMGGHKKMSPDMDFVIIDKSPLGCKGLMGNEKPGFGVLSKPGGN
jgi:hypothetical protein